MEVQVQGQPGPPHEAEPAGGNPPGWRIPLLLLVLGACMVLVGFVASRGDGHGLAQVTTWREPGPGQPSGSTGPEHPGNSLVASLRIAPNAPVPDVLLQTGPDVHVLQLGAVAGRLTLALVGPGFERQSVDLGPEEEPEARDVVISVQGGDGTVTIDIQGVRTSWRPQPPSPPRLSLEGLRVGPASSRIGPVQVTFEERPGTGIPAGMMMLIGMLMVAVGVSFTVRRLHVRQRPGTPRPWVIGVALVLMGIAMGAVGARGEPPSQAVLTSSSAGVATYARTMLNQSLVTVLPTWAAPVRSLDATLGMDVGNNETSTHLVLSSCQPTQSPCPSDLTVGLAGARPSISIPLKGQPAVRVIGPEFTPGPHTIGLRISSSRDLLITLDGTLFKQVRWARPIALPGESLVLTVGQDSSPADPTRYTISSTLSSETAAGLSRALDTLAWWGCVLLIGAGVTVLCALLTRRAVPGALTGDARTMVVTISAVVATGWSLALVWSLTQPEPALSDAAGIVVRNSPFFSNDYRFSDFFQPFYYASSGDPYSLAGSNYPPFGNLLLAPFNVLPPRAALAAFLGLTVGAILGIVSVALRTSERKRGLLPSAVLAANFPVLFAVDRGNIDLAVIVLMLLAAMCMPLRRGLAGLALGAAVAIKLFPVVLVAPLLRSRRWPLGLLGFAAGSVGLTVLALPFTAVDSIGGLRSAILSSTAASADAATAASFGSSIRSGILALGLFAPSMSPGTEAIVGSAWWLPVTLSVAGGLILWSFAIERRPWRAWLIASSAALTTPAVSGIYHAAMILAPLVVLARMRDRAPWPRSIGLLLGVILAPTALWHAGATQVSTSSVLVPVALCGLVVGLCAQGLLDIARDSVQSRRRLLRLGAIGAMTGLATVIGCSVVGVTTTPVAHVAGVSNRVPTLVQLPAEMCPTGELPAGVTVSGTFAWGGRDYASVFSTAPANEGLRMEITPDGSAGILVPGWIVPQGLYLPHRIRKGEPTHFSAHFDGSSMSLTVGDETVSTAIQDYDPACRWLNVGAGFSGERDFDGPVRTTMVQTQTPGLAVRTLFLSGWVLLVMSALIVLTCITGRGQGDRPSKDTRVLAPPPPESELSDSATPHDEPNQSAATKLPTTTLSMHTEFDEPIERA